MASHPYKAFMAGQNSNHPNHRSNRKIHLSPVEEHYLKKSLIKNQIISELNSLSPNYNDISGLRRFGPPFVPSDPQNFLKNSDSSTLEQIYAISEANLDIFKNQFPLIRFIFENYIVTFPFIKIHLNKLGPSLKDQSKFWLKIQVLFELFKSKKISNSNDRGTTSKRKLILYKFQSLFLVLFNSSIYCSQDPQYFEMDKERRGAYKKLGKFIDAAESEQIQDNERKEEEAKLQLDNDHQDLLNMNLSPETLLNHLDDIGEDEFINGYYINVVGVSVESETKSTFWGSKESSYYSFIIHVKKEGEENGWFIKRRYSEFNKLYKDLKMAYPGSHIPDLPSKDKHEVEMNLDSTDTTINETVKNANSNDNNLHNFDSGMTDLDKESVDALFATSMGSPTSQSFSSFNDSNMDSSSVQLSGDTVVSPTSSVSGLLKSPKLPGFSKPNFLKSPMSSPLLQSKKNDSINSKTTNKIEKSFLSSFKKPAWASPTSSTSSSTSTLNQSENEKSQGLQISSSSKSHIRNSSLNSTISEVSADSIDSDRSTETFQSIHTDHPDELASKMEGMVVKDDKVIFPREILRQTLRGFLRYVLYIKVCARSPEIAKFLGDKSSKIELTKHDITDIQHRVNIDHLRTLQHYKFQSALVGIVKVLEKDVENLKTQIYNEGFGYIFERIKHFQTLHELCGYDANISSGSWLKAANLISTNVSMNEESSEVSSDPNDSAAPLRGLVRIVLLEIASTQYELLIGSDSAMGTLKTIKRLHSVFPYRLIAGILRFTNPLMMVKRLIDVFTYQMPTVAGVSGGVSAIGTGIGNGIGGMMQGLGWKWKKDSAGDEEKYLTADVPTAGDHSNSSASKKGRSLLQLIFSGMLGDDLRKLEKEIVEVRDLLTSYTDNTGEYGEGEIIISRIDKYFSADDLVVLHIKQMSQTLGIEIPTAVLMPSNGLNDCENISPLTVQNILEDYSHKKKEEIANAQKATEESEESKESDKEANKEREDKSPYLLARRYFYLQLRKYDKESLMELWNEPELMSVIKEVISLFLSPLIELFKKAEVYKYVPILARYIGELIEVCEVYACDYGQFGRSDVVGALVGLAEKYSEDVYRFIRDMYLNDIKDGEESGNGKLFEGIVEWLNGIVSFLRFVKKERPDLMIDLNELLTHIDLNKEEKLSILKVIGDVVTKAEKKKAVLEKMEATGEMQKKEAERERENDWMKMARNRKVDNNWDAIHNRVFKVGEQIAGESEGDVYDMAGLDGVEDGDDMETDSEAEDVVSDDALENSKPKRKMKLRDYDWNINEFMNGYYNKDWSKIDSAIIKNVYGGNEFMEASGCGTRIAEVFKQKLQDVLAEYTKSQHR